MDKPEFIDLRAVSWETRVRTLERTLGAAERALAPRSKEETVAPMP